MSTGRRGIVVRKVDMRHAQPLRHRLQFAVAVGDADGADVIAFDEQQLQRHQAVVREASRSWW